MTTATTGNENEYGSFKPLGTDDATHQQDLIEKKRKLKWIFAIILLVVVAVAIFSIIFWVIIDDDDDDDESGGSPLGVTCPGANEGTPPSGQAPIPDLQEYNQALMDLDIAAVIADLEVLFTDSQECWPADEFQGIGTSYGPFFIRLTWHCSGSFRATDGAGGCGGGRQRFWPEASWDDNTNLDKARALLAPIKNKYGVGLSWGDLMVFAGTAAILNMGGPITEICAGRIDSANGSLSEVLGPGPLAPNCSVQGDCPAPLGADTIGLIYVNPEGFMGIPDPVLSAPQIREVFGRMDMDDRETVALIGGGHAFGKTHGACPEGAGDPPSEAPDNPWPGMCGTGRGVDTFTSGFEGPWTSNPLRWDNQFFQLLADEVFVVDIGPGGKHQWRIDNPMNEADADLMMLTSDLALVYDSNYSSLVTEFAADQNALDIAFSNAWAKLTTDGGVWADAKKCINGTQA